MKKLYFILFFLLAEFLSAKSQTNKMTDSGYIITRYLGGSGIDLKNSEELKRFLLTHGVDKDGFETFIKLQSAYKLEIRNDTILYAYDVGRYDANAFIRKPYIMHEHINSNIKLPIKDWPNHKVFFLQKDNIGTHILGGKRPDNFILPHHDSLKTPFTFIGTIDGTTPEFQWLGVEKLHIAFPLYNCDNGVFLDYSNPNNPAIIEPTNFTDYFPDENHEVLKDIVFTETRYASSEKIEEKTQEESDYIQCGVPLWYQDADIPQCPKTGEVMKFVCTIPSDREIKIIEPNGKIPFSSDYLIFADYGHLFIFYNPKSKILHAKWQW